MAYAAGVDVGSTQTKAVIIDEAKEIVSRSLTDTGANVMRAAEKSYEEALLSGNLSEEEVEFVVGTGYGRYKVTFGNTQVTEISCHGRGAVHMFPGTRTVVDMGGQDTKAIRVSRVGEILDFCMNDKCAAGTGRFLGAASSALDIPLGDLGPTALRGERPVKISTTCTVFAESEVLSWLGKGKKIEDILLGVHQSIAARSAGLLRRVRGGRDVHRRRGAQPGDDRDAERASGRRGQRERGIALHGRAGCGSVRARSHPGQPGAGEERTG
jgi:predicted CoA-substrate-specific enzyme activase